MFTVLADTTVAINLDSPTALTAGQFSVLKKLAGNAADLVYEDTEFTVRYSFPAGKGFEAGEGTLTVKADGTVVTSNPLPHGAVVTLTEADPAKAKGAARSERTFSQSEVTIGNGTMVEVRLTNSITEGSEEPEK
ncbi:hypothetical protein SAMN06298212_14417 [Ruaniaceae bacterium KH17]|nr:hypothetical protein SAMN06298212_14417 [Ruaniaceae bacterium KH17]